MHESIPSKTAMRVAMRRAAHQILDDPIVFEDPIATKIIGPERAAALTQLYDQRPRSRSTRGFFAARSRFAEDELAKAVEHGVRQYVILGAGLDTFAYRNANPELRVFEVDHPATQAWKQQLLVEAEIPMPDLVTFVPTDFEQEHLAERLLEAGLHTDLPTFYSWLGVTMYLTEEAILGTLDTIRSLTPKGSGVVFDYSLDRSLLDGMQQWVYDTMAERVAVAGEPWVSTFVPAALIEKLQALGFSEVEDYSAEKINSRYFGARADGLKVGSLAHFMKAVV